MTLEGLARKYKTKKSVIKTVLKWGKRNLKTVEPRRGSTHSVTIKDRSSNQYNKLNSEQKALFREILEKNVADRRMPSNENLDKIKPLKYEDHRVNEKFRKLLLILCNRENEINVTLKSIRRLKQELEIWKKLAKRTKIKSEENSSGNSLRNIIEISDDDTQAAFQLNKRNSDDEIVSSASEKRNKGKQQAED